MTKQRFIRPGDRLDDDTVIVVRGGALEAAVLCDDASIMHEAYGIYGISVFAVREVTLDELAQRSPLVRFGTLTLVTVGEVRGCGLGLEATGRNPQHFTVIFDDLDTGSQRC
jgi:hypothetical protein